MTFYDETYLYNIKIIDSIMDDDNNFNSLLYQLFKAILNTNQRLSMTKYKIPAIMFVF